MRGAGHKDIPQLDSSHAWLHCDGVLYIPQSRASCGALGGSRDYIGGAAPPNPPVISLCILRELTCCKRYIYIIYISYIIYIYYIYIYIFGPSGHKRRSVFVLFFHPSQSFNTERPTNVTLHNIDVSANALQSCAYFSELGPHGGLVDKVPVAKHTNNSVKRFSTIFL